MSAKRAAICAVAQLPFEKAIWHKRIQEMCFDVVEPVLEQTGVKFCKKPGDGGIRSIVTVSDDVFDARTISNNAIQDAVGAHNRGEDKVAMDGINAIAYAVSCILSGHDDLILLVGHCKESQAESRNMCTNLAFDPFYLRPLGLDFETLNALQARDYMAKSGVTDEHLAKVVVRSRRNAAKNPVANARDEVTMEEVMNSPMAYDPLRELHIYPQSDGAIAMLIAGEDRVKEFTGKPVWVSGFGNCMDSYFPGDKDLASNFPLKKAAKLAYRMAGVTDPAKEFDFAELNDAAAYQLPMWAEGVGLCADGAGGEWIDGGGMEKMNVNPSGGMLAGNPIMLGGLARAAELVIQLRGDAGERQVAGARRGVANGTTGAAGQLQSVLVLENDRAGR